MPGLVKTSERYVTGRASAMPDNLCSLRSGHDHPGQPSIHAQCLLKMNHVRFFHDRRQTGGRQAEVG